MKHLTLFILFLISFHCFSQKRDKKSGCNIQSFSHLIDGEVDEFIGEIRYTHKRNSYLYVLVSNNTPTLMLSFTTLSPKRPLEIERIRFSTSDSVETIEFNENDFIYSEGVDDRHTVVKNSGATIHRSTTIIYKEGLDTPAEKYMGLVNNLISFYGKVRLEGKFENREFVIEKGDARKLKQMLEFYDCLMNSASLIIKPSSNYDDY